MSQLHRVRVLQVCTIHLTARVFIAPVARYLSTCGYEVAIACSTADAPDGARLAYGYDEGARFSDETLSIGCPKTRKVGEGQM